MLFTRTHTLLIALALIVPEGLRTYAKALEPYPAVILPAGDVPVRVEDGTVTIKRTYLSARRNGRWQAVDERQFMAPISRHYFRAVARRGFGLVTSANAPARRREESEETKRWMRAKLIAQGFAPTKVRVINESITVALPSGARVSAKVRSTKVHALD